MLSKPVGVDLEGLYIVMTAKPDITSNESLATQLAETGAKIAAAIKRLNTEYPDTAANAAPTDGSTGAEVEKAAAAAKAKLETYAERIGHVSGEGKTMAGGFIQSLIEQATVRIRDVHLRLESRPMPGPPSYRLGDKKQAESAGGTDWGRLAWGAPSAQDEVKDAAEFGPVCQRLIMLHNRLRRALGLGSASESLDGESFSSEARLRAGLTSSKGVHGGGTAT